MLDYVFVDAEGNLIGGSYVRPNDPAGDRPVWITLNPSERSEDPIVWTNPYEAYTSIAMPLNRAPLFVSGLPSRLPGGGHAMERIRRKAKRSKKAATYSRRLRARGSSPSSARSSKCPDGSYWSWAKKKCMKSMFR